MSFGICERNGLSRGGVGNGEFLTKLTLGFLTF